MPQKQRGPVCKKHETVAGSIRFSSTANGQRQYLPNFTRICRYENLTHCDPPLKTLEVGSVVVLMGFVGHTEEGFPSEKSGRIIIRECTNDSLSNSVPVNR